MGHLYSGIRFGRKKDEILPFVTMWVDLESVTLREIQTEKDKQITHVWDIKQKATNKQTTQTNERRHVDADAGKVVTGTGGRGVSQIYHNRGWWAHSATSSWCVTELSAGSLYNRTNPNTFNLKSVSLFKRMQLGLVF